MNKTNNANTAAQARCQTIENLVQLMQAARDDHTCLPLPMAGDDRRITPPLKFQRTRTIGVFRGGC